MSSATPLPKTGEVFFDARGDQRAMRLSWHPDADVVVLSLWNQGTCVATFRLASTEITPFIEALAQGLPQQPRGRRHAPAPVTAPQDVIPPSPAEDIPLTGQYQHPRH
ncbi:hypothetical protein [Actinocorallia longicatena]|uniref:Uncharacterized protein n=1 Tax=Actinocorallia longicatena TaxID=111803 RepID=A0ABP6QIK0_9ACTN